MVGLDALYFRSLRRMSIVDDDNGNARVAVDPIFFYVWEYDQDVNKVFLLRLQNMQEVSLAPFLPCRARPIWACSHTVKSLVTVTWFLLKFLEMLLNYIESSKNSLENAFTWKSGCNWWWDKFIFWNVQPTVDGWDVGSKKSRSYSTHRRERPLSICIKALREEQFQSK